MNRENKFGILANLILVMLMSSSITQTLYSSLFMTKTLGWLIFLAVIPFTLLLFVMFRTKFSTLISFVSIGVILVIGLSVIIFKIGVQDVLIWSNRYSIWFIDVTNGYKDNIVPVFANSTVLCLTFLITLFVFIFTIKYYNFYVATILFFSVFYIQLELKTPGSELSFVLFIFSFLLYYFFYILQRRSKEKTYDTGNKLKYLLYILPVCIVVMSLTLMFPQKQDRISIPWLDKKVSSTIDKIVDKFSGVDVSSFDYFSFGISGFGKTDRLGGDLRLNNTHVMNVKSDHSNLYLRASSKVYYDGHKWYSDVNKITSLGSAQEFTKQLNSDTELLYNSISGAFGKTVDITENDFFDDSLAQVDFVNLKTKSLFIPAKPYKLSLKTNKEILLDNEQMLSTKDVQSKGFSYSIGYYNINLKSEDLISLLRKSKKPDNKLSIEVHYNLDSSKVDINSNNSMVFVKSLDSVEFQDFSSEMTNGTESSDTFYTRYTQVPETVTPRVRELAEDITSGKSNNYDKAKAVETYLSKNYPYTLVPGNPPRSRDFVDYFLFEGKKGYCTYYASAMTIMLRCLDIPARYVEGYMLPPDRKDGVYKVTNQQAHAWVEVYFEGFGWIPFEPTSPFVANLYEDRTISATVSSEMMDTSYQDYMEMMNKYRNQSAGLTINPTIVDNTDSGMSPSVLILIIASSLIGAILLALCTIASVNYFRFYNLQRKIKKGDPNTSILTAYNYILKALKFQGVAIIPGETPTQFGERVEKLFDIRSFSFNKTSFIKISGYYVKARYSRNSLSETAVTETLEFIDILLNLIIEKSGRFKVGFYRYFLGRF